MASSKKIKVLQAIRQGQVGGGESHIISLVENIDKTIFEPVILSFTDGQMIETLNYLGVRNYVIPSKKAFDFRKWKEVKSLLQKESIDLVHVHGTRAGSNVYWAVKQLKLPLVYTIHGWSFHNDQSWFIKRLRIFFEHWLTHKTDKNITVSLPNQKTGKENISHFDSVVINNGIDLNRFDPDKRFENVRLQLGISEDKCLIGFIGRITAQKDPLTLLKAFKKVREKNKNALLLIVGDGELKPQAIQLANELNIKDAVVFEGFRNDIPDVLNAVDIFCLPSLWEGLPIALLEAMAMSKAVVATAVDGSAEILRNQQNSLTIPVRNEDALAETLSKLIDDKVWRRELGEQAKQTVTANYSAEKMTRQIEKLYLDVLHNSQPTMLKG